MTGEPTLHCPYCGLPTRILYVHGHGQCEICGTSVDECCRGERAGAEDGQDPGMDD